ncbi:hypothetical protein BH11BAC4_BH11BAC4_25110 [soil metagenome]
MNKNWWAFHVHLHILPELLPGSQCGRRCISKNVNWYKKIELTKANAVDESMKLSLSVAGAMEFYPRAGINR